MSNATQFPLNSREWAKWLESRIATVERSINPTATRIANEIAAQIFWDNGGGSGGGGSTYQVFTPIGAPIPFLTDTIPTGFIEYDGAIISRLAPYDKLFAVLGTKYGAGDGSTTFGLPNLKSRTIVGVDPADPAMDATGETGGEKTHVLTIAEMPSHDHGDTDAATVPVNSTIVVAGSNPAGGSHINMRGTSSSPAAGDLSGSSHTHNIPPQGGGGAHNNLQPFMAGRWIARYADVALPPPTTPMAVLATPNTLVLRDANGRSQIVDPLAPEDIANKAYVDAQSGDSLPPEGPNDDVLTVVAGVWASAPPPESAEIHVGTTPPTDTGDFWYDPSASGGGGTGSQEVRHDNTGTYDYMGVAPSGTADSASGWTVTRITLTSPPVTGVASGAWTGRAGLVYV